MTHVLPGTPAPAELDVPEGAVLDGADLAQLIPALREADSARALFDAVAVVAQARIGHRLFTIMSFDAARFEVERLYTSMPEHYPVGGRKKKARTDWGAHTLASGRVFRANDSSGIRTHFDDHGTLLGLGLDAILNIPVMYAGRCLGTMNMMHASGHYTAAHEALGMQLGAFLTAPLLEYALRRPAH